MKNINTSTFDFRTRIYAGVNCSPRKNIRTVADETAREKVYNALESEI